MEKTAAQKMNDLFFKPTPVKITFRGESIDLFIRPLSTDDAEEMKKVMGEELMTEEAIKFCICRTVRDEEGNQVWTSPEEISTLPAVVVHQLRVEVFKVQFGVDITQLKADPEEAKEEVK